MTGSDRPALFVTGASGFVGARLLALLQTDRFARVTLLARGALPVPEGLRGRVEIVRGDLRDPAAYAPHIAPGAVVLHLAARTGAGTRREHFAANEGGTRALVTAAGERRAGRLLFLSSIACGFRTRIGYHYADAKEAAERHVAASGLPWAVVRATMVLGHGGAIWSAIADLAGRPRMVRPGGAGVRVQPIWVDDLAHVLAEEVARPSLTNEIAELGGPDVLTFDEVLARVSRRLRGTASPIVHVPARPVAWALRALELVLPVRLPVSAGQLGSFMNDGVARPDPRLASRYPALLGVDEMLDRLMPTGGAAARSVRGREDLGVTPRTE